MQSFLCVFEYVSGEVLLLVHSVLLHAQGKKSSLALHSSVQQWWQRKQWSHMTKHVQHIWIPLRLNHQSLSTLVWQEMQINTHSQFSVYYLWPTHDCVFVWNKGNCYSWPPIQDVNMEWISRHFEDDKASKLQLITCLLNCSPIFRV